uniref:Macaca fascicularis brain cDNA, clone: QflA-18020 n=1 Tax=Macaca fascicularis TaxID=9541 RepID=I7GI90_MACFA|nr:unnamed protein product [Macaca fascicularis]
MRTARVARGSLPENFLRCLVTTEQTLLPTGTKILPAFVSFSFLSFYLFLILYVCLFVFAMMPKKLSKINLGQAVLTGNPELAGFPVWITFQLCFKDV